jgi:hypothetical protein
MFGNLCHFCVVFFFAIIAISENFVLNLACIVYFIVLCDVIPYILWPFCITKRVSISLFYRKLVSITVFLYFTSHRHGIGHLATLQLCWWRKTSGAPHRIISGTNGHWNLINSSRIYFVFAMQKIYILNFYISKETVFSSIKYEHLYIYIYISLKKMTFKFVLNNRPLAMSGY